MALSMHSSQAVTPKLVDLVDLIPELTLGSGTYGVVDTGTWKATGITVALKHVNVGGWLSTMQEAKALTALEHQNVVGFYGLAVNAKQGITLILEYASLGSLLSIISRVAKTKTKSSDAWLPENVIKGTAQQLLQAVNYMHSKEWAHNDITSSNVLVTGKGVIKLADFGLANDSGPKTNPRVVTLPYRAPEVLTFPPGKRCYNPQQSDMWSVGCVLAELACGNRLFNCDKDTELHGMHQEYAKHGEDYVRERCYIKGSITDSLVKLINHLVCMDPDKRITAKAALQDPWFSQYPAPILPSPDNLGIHFTDPALNKRRADPEREHAQQSKQQRA